MLRQFQGGTGYSGRGSRQTGGAGISSSGFCSSNALLFPQAQRARPPPLRSTFSGPNAHKDRPQLLKPLCSLDHSHGAPNGWGPHSMYASELAVLRSEVQALRDQVQVLQQQQELGNRLLAQEMKRKLTKEDYDCLPHRIIILRHGESHGNVEKSTYCTQPDHTVGLTAKGRQQAIATGQHLRRMLEAAHNGRDLNLFFMTSPYCRTLETTDAVMDAFENDQVVGLRQAVQLREQDFGNFQDPQRINQDLCDRNKFGRFWFRFPNGESGADVYDRLTIFEDHLTRDMFMGRFADTNLVLVTHGLTLRIFLMRWFHWSVDEFLQVYNPANCDPVIVEKLPWETVVEIQNQKYAHAKHVYYITSSSMAKLRGCQLDMCSYMPRHSGRIRDKWKAQRKRTGPPVGNPPASNPTYSDVPNFNDAPPASSRKSPQPPLLAPNGLQQQQQQQPLARFPSTMGNNGMPQYAHQHHASLTEQEVNQGYYQRHLQYLGDSNILPRHGFKNKEMAQRQLQQQQRQSHVHLEQQQQQGQQPHRQMQQQQQQGQQQ